MNAFKGRGCRPRTPVSLIRAPKGSAFGNRQLFEKSWAKTFGFVALFTYNFFLMARPHNAELTNAVEPINNVSSETKPLKAACYEPEAATCRKKLDQNFWFRCFIYL
ncbi:MAG: hypothetical protein ACI4JM_02820 [Oscillospiraceae bacterium]